MRPSCDLPDRFAGLVAVAAEIRVLVGIALVLALSLVGQLTARSAVAQSHRLVCYLPDVSEQDKP